MSTFADQYLDETRRLLERLDGGALERLARALADVRRQGGRLFILGVGGSAGHASHAVNDFRKLCGIEAYAPTDNAPELTARINDEGWETCFANWLHASRLSARDALLIFSVGGGSCAKKVSVNIVYSIELAQTVGAKVFGIVGRDGGFTAASADACVVIPPLFPERVTPHTEGLCAVLWHLLVSHPALQQAATKWESVVAQAVRPPEDVAPARPRVAVSGGVS
jgi:D-sedoheptulose 7-phosphate isomerase